MSDSMIAMLAQTGVEETQEVAEHEAKEYDPYEGINSCDALRIIDGVVDDEFADAHGLSECMADMEARFHG